ncbi:MAG: hypothetical protein JW986_07815 [Methanotrichaceae archaeon]|nr:hypothetical protein [Methanotrichaceae archaeon]
MTSIQPTILLRLCVPEGGRVGLDEVGELLVSIQNMAWHMGSYLEGQPYSESGRMKKQILEDYGLVITSLESGSVIIVAEPAQVSTQADLASPLPYQLPGTRAITKITDLLESIHGEDGRAIEDVIGDPSYRSRMLSDLARLWPKKHGHTLEFKGQGNRRFLLSASNRPILDRMVSQGERRTGEEINFGILADLRVENGKTISIERVGERFTAEYPPELETKARELLGAPVRVVGRAERSMDGTRIKRFYIDHIERFERYSLDDFVVAGRTYSPKIPVDVQVDYEDCLWLLSHPILDAIGKSADYSEAQTMFEEYIDFLWNEYVSCETDDLGETGKMMRDILQLIFEVS